ncbi:MAG TPA: chemotaxis protein CheC [Candidatus Nanoarchaeia archaeon]|nr:chemotaxis protein CheC [Candidatus Nanoarchaeia archaeon]
MNKQINIDATSEQGNVKASFSEQSQVDSGILLELGSIGAGHAATSLSDVIQQPVTIDLPKILNLQVHLIPSFYNLHEVPTIGVFLQLMEDNGCDILLMLELSEARKIAAMMTMASSIEELDPSMETSAIHELANILIGSFLTAISDFVGMTLLPTTPQSALDTFDAILDTFLVKQSMLSESALIFETRFKRLGEDAKCILMIFPSSELRNQLIQKSKTLLNL